MNRIVQVFVADTDERVPVQKRLVFADKEPRFTDLTDDEIKMAMGLSAELDRHNAEVRGAIRDPEYRDQAVFLEPVRIRDLSIVIKTIVRF